MGGGGGESSVLSRLSHAGFGPLVNRVRDMIPGGLLPYMTLWLPLYVALHPVRIHPGLFKCHVNPLGNRMCERVEF